MSTMTLFDKESSLFKEYQGLAYEQLRNITIGGGNTLGLHEVQRALPMIHEPHGRAYAGYQGLTLRPANTLGRLRLKGLPSAQFFDDP
ncbi:hypothetical protein M422DRAFT_276374 [Sphaerobolus stellatus SS14]|uniref:Uncharacterized protein n=1 Tax=Sphaerobolus stellatus (strain SS14) TaxID=990650 RepID=A0A0C9UCD4_SPHS4|nr:hypothetical protein M422DRAFT_276374 [Sphaerobolus stellatus SS14]